MCEASRPLFYALCFLSAVLIGWVQIHEGYNDHFQGGLLGHSLGW